LEQTIEDPVPDGVGITHVSQGEMRWIPQRKDCGWLEETNSETIFPRKMQVRQPSPQKPYYYHPSSMLRKEGMSL
jgi:hypothetical protein